MGSWCKLLCLMFTPWVLQFYILSYMTYYWSSKISCGAQGQHLDVTFLHKCQHIIFVKCDYEKTIHAYTQTLQVTSVCFQTHSDIKVSCKQIVCFAILMWVLKVFVSHWVCVQDMPDGPIIANSPGLHSPDTPCKTCFFCFLWVSTM